MEKNDFIKQLTQFFRLKGFSRKNGNNYYKDLTNEVMLVFGIQKSTYGGYCYIESGYVFKSINKHLPYPKYYDTNLNCGRIIVNTATDGPFGKFALKPTYYVDGDTIQFAAIIYSDIDDRSIEIVEKKIDERIEEMSHFGQLNKSELIEHYINDKPLGSWLLLGWKTVDYFGLPHEMGDLYRMTMDDDWGED